MAARAAVLAQAALAPPNPQQARCIEVFAETPQEKKHRETLQEVIKCSMGNDQGTKCLTAVFGSEAAARAAEEKVRIAMWTRRVGLLRKSGKEGHLPSVYLLAGYPTTHQEVRGVPDLMTPEESLAAYRSLHDHHFPFAARELAGECWRAPDEPCRNLIREAGFRGDMYAWERLADTTTRIRHHLKSALCPLSSTTPGWSWRSSNGANAVGRTNPTFPRCNRKISRKAS
jgi:hypothetical protein